MTILLGDRARFPLKLRPKGLVNRCNRCRGHQGTQKRCQRPRQRFCLYKSEKNLINAPAAKYHTQKSVYQVEKTR